MMFKEENESGMFSLGSRFSHSTVQPCLIGGACNLFLERIHNFIFNYDQAQMVDHVSLFRAALALITWTADVLGEV